MFHYLYCYCHCTAGMGTLSYADGDKYVGEWKDGKKSGKGELIYINGDKFRYRTTWMCLGGAQ